MKSKNNFFMGVIIPIFLIVGFVPLGFSESLRMQLEQEIEADQIQCDNDSHVLVLRTNGKLACVTEGIIEKTRLKIIETNIILTEKEYPSSSNTIQSSIPGFEEIEIGTYKNNTQINLENKTSPKDNHIKQDLDEEIKETDEENHFESILIISVFLVPIPVIVILFKKWWDS